MKKFLLGAALSMCALTGFSQVKWDAKIGMSMSNLTQSDWDMKVGYTLGAGMDYQFTDMLHLQSGLNITGKGAKLGNIKIKTHYLELPILAALKFDIASNMKFVVNAGPYMGIGLGGKIKYEDEGVSINEKVFSKVAGEDESMMKRFDLGLQYGVGLEINEHYLINLTGQYGFITPMRYDNDYKGDKSKNLAFLISVGYRF